MGGRKSRRSSDVELRRSGDEGRGGGESRGGRGGRTEGEGEKKRNDKRDIACVRVTGCGAGRGEGARGRGRRGRPSATEEERGREKGVNFLSVKTPLEKEKRGPVFVIGHPRVKRKSGISLALHLSLLPSLCPAHRAVH
jgi:hypothetical protein